MVSPLHFLCCSTKLRRIYLLQSLVLTFAYFLFVCRCLLYPCLNKRTCQLDSTVYKIVIKCPTDLELKYCTPIIIRDGQETKKYQKLDTRI